MLVGAAGADHKIYIYDVKASTNSIVSLSGHEEALVCLQFSENGYYLATAAEDGKVRSQYQDRSIGSFTNSDRPLY